MKRKLCIKRLTSSDLTLFEWHYRNRNAGNQKAINLNADVFVGHLYPALPEISDQRGGKLPLDLFISGPGAAPELNLQRKIVKIRSYKNWRLNGEFIHNPSEDPERFNALSSGDFAVIEFRGDVFPDSARLILLSRSATADLSIVQRLDQTVSSMAAIDREELATIVESARPAPEHPIHELLIEGDLEDAALGGAVGTRRLLIRRSGRLMSREALARARESAEEIGNAGEELVAAHLAGRKRAGTIRDYEWTSIDNAIAPYDFVVTALDGTRTFIDVKSTSGEFDRPLHISGAEVAEMANADLDYRIYRVFEITSGRGNLKVSDPLKPFGQALVTHFDNMPEGVTVDSVSLPPTRLTFGPTLVLDGGGTDNPAEESE